MFVAAKTLIGAGMFFFCMLLCFLLLMVQVNATYRPHSPSQQRRIVLLRGLPFASPAIIPAGRNIAFETGNVITNAPASYLTMLDCCESDEAIADRIAVGNLKAKVIRK